MVHDPTRDGNGKLGAEEIRRYDLDGYAGPFTLCSPEEMAPIRERIEQEVLTRDSPWPVDRRKDRHLDSRVVYDLAAHPALLERMQSVLGPDLLLFATSLFVKEPGYPPFPWHCDGPYWPMEPLVGVTAWVAIDEATRENGCVSIAPGSHRKPVPHRPFGYGRLDRLKQRLGIRSLQGVRADTAFVDTTHPVHMTVRPGQFFLFPACTVHMAGANRTSRRRTGLAVRMTVPLVRLRHDEIFPGHRAVLVRGEDRYGWNRLAEPPA